MPEKSFQVGVTDPFAKSVKVRDFLPQNAHVEIHLLKAYNFLIHGSPNLFKNP